MKSLFLLITILLFGGAAVLGPVPISLAQQGDEIILYTQDFESGKLDGWELESGWQVIQDGETQVLAGEGHHWARPGVGYTGDFRLQFRLKLLRGRIHLVYRLNDTGRYFIGFQQDGSDLNKQYWPDTFQNGLTGSSASHNLETWHQIEIIGQGATLRFLVNGQEEWVYTDSAPLSGGSFAFETLDDSAAYVDDILIYGPAPAPTPTPDIRFTWVRTGGPLGGLGYDVRMRPDNPDIMYVTDAWAGAFMSTDSGRTWFPSNQGITTRVGATGDGIPVFTLNIDPNNPDIVWAGTQYQRGIFKSTDGGQTWTRMDNGIVEADGITFRGFAIDPTNSDVVYAAAEISSWTWFGQPRMGREFDMTGGVVYKTTDGGQNWKKVWEGDNLARYIWIDPRDTHVLYVSTGIFDREAANSDPAARVPGGVGILKSTDGGQTWQQINNGLGNLYVGTLFMHPKNPDILLAGTGNVQYQEGAGLYLSTDGGATWKQTLSSIFTEAVEFASSNPAIAYAGDNYGIYRSEDGGQTWELVSGNREPDNRFGWGSPGVRGGHPIDFQVDPRNPDRLFINAYGGGNFLSEDGGRTWIDTSKGYTGALTRDIVADLSEPGWVVVAGRSGIFVSYNGGQDWEGLNYPELFSSEWEAVAIDPRNPQHLIASNNWVNALANSTDGGYSWQVRKDFTGEKVGWRAIAFAPSNPSIVYAGSAGYISAGAFDYQVPGHGIYLSGDGGQTWSPANDATTQDAHVFSLAVDPGNPDVVYAATSNRGLLKTTDAGTTWAELPSPTRATPIFTIALRPGEPNTLYAGLWKGGVYRSTDGGQTWQHFSAGLPPEASISDIVFDPSNPDMMYTSDLFSGVYRSEDGGARWKTINNGLDFRSVNAMAISADGLHLYAATEGGGVYRLDLSGQPPSPALKPTPTAILPTPTPMPRPSTPVLATPTAVVLAPSATPLPTEPVSTPGPLNGRGLCGGTAALPLALLSLVWIRRSKR